MAGVMILDGDGHTVATKECRQNYGQYSDRVIISKQHIPSKTMTNIEIGFCGMGSAHVILVALSESCILLTLAVDM